MDRIDQPNSENNSGLFKVKGAFRWWEYILAIILSLMLEAGYLMLAIYLLEKYATCDNFGSTSIFFIFFVWVLGPVLLVLFLRKILPKSSDKQITNISIIRVPALVAYVLGAMYVTAGLVFFAFCGG